MKVDWLLGSAYQQLEHLNAEVMANERGLAVDKSRFSRMAKERLVSPLGLASCFGVGCAAELWLEKTQGKTKIRWSTIGTTLYAMVNKIVQI